MSKKVVMIVDDEWMNREVIEAYLVNAGYEVISAHSGEHALEMVAQRSVDVVLLDMRMQGMNGVEVCRRLKAHSNTQHTPVLIVTALTNEKEKVEAITAGADDFISKPLDSALMLNRVKSFSRFKQLAQALETHEEILRSILSRHVNNELAETILNEFNALSSNQTVE